MRCFGVNISCPPFTATPESSPTEEQRPPAPLVQNQPASTQSPSASVVRRASSTSLQRRLQSQLSGAPSSGPVRADGDAHQSTLPNLEVPSSVGRSELKQHSQESISNVLSPEQQADPKSAPTTSLCAARARERVILSEQKAGFLSRAAKQNILTGPYLTVENVREIGSKLVAKHNFSLVLNSLRLDDSDAASQVIKGISLADMIEDLVRYRSVAQEENKAIGYMYALGEARFRTVGIGTGIAHFESYVICPNGNIVNVVPYSNQMAAIKVCMILQKKAQPYYISHSHGIASTSPSPQATTNECGSLGLSYMKEILKDDAKQLRSYSLQIDYRPSPSTDGSEEWPANFFFPSPQVLRYSQSTLYIEVLRAMLEGTEETVSIEGRGETLNVKTLQGLLKNGMATIKTPEGKPVDEETLAEFRQRWLNVLNDEVLPKREAMNRTRPDNDKPLNMYLAYNSTRHVAKADNQAFPVD